jgi:hypothetical protein
MDENRDPCDDNDMIVVFMRIFMWMLMMTMIVWVWCEDFLEEVDYEKTYNKGINRILTHLESFRKDVDEWDRKHRTSTESDEEVEDFLINFFKKIEYNSNGRNHEKSNDNKERRHRGERLRIIFLNKNYRCPLLPIYALHTEIHEHEYTDEAREILPQHHIFCRWEIHDLDSMYHTDKHSIFPGQGCGVRAFALWENQALDRLWQHW